MAASPHQTITIKWAAAALPSYWGIREGLRRRLRYRPRDGGSFCLVGGVGSRTGAGLSLARIALSVLIAQPSQKGDPGLAVSVEGREPR
jgi:hypothetical protein